MARQDIPLSEALKDSNPKINDNFAELYGGFDDAGAHAARDDNPHNTTREQVAAAPVYSQTINIMTDSGRFAGKVNPFTIPVGTFSSSGFFSPLNSATAFASAGKFINNNTTNGGTQGELAQDVQDLLAAMDRAGLAARHGPEFHIAQTTMGAGTALAYTAHDGITRYLVTSNGSRAFLGFGSFATAVVWVRIKSGASLAIRRRDELRRADVWQDTDVILTPSDGWTHILSRVQSSSGFDSHFPNFYAREGDVIQIACPAFFSGQAYPGVHTAPLPSFNELVAV